MKRIEFLSTQIQHPDSIVYLQKFYILYETERLGNVQSITFWDLATRKKDKGKDAHNGWGGVYVPAQIESDG